MTSQLLSGFGPVLFPNQTLVDYQRRISPLGFAVFALSLGRAFFRGSREVVVINYPRNQWRNARMGTENQRTSLHEDRPRYANHRLFDFQRRFRDALILIATFGRRYAGAQKNTNAVQS